MVWHHVRTCMRGCTCACVRASERAHGTSARARESVRVRARVCVWRARALGNDQHCRPAHRRPWPHIAPVLCVCVSAHKAGGRARLGDRMALNWKHNVHARPHARPHTRTHTCTYARKLARCIVMALYSYGPL